MKYEGRSNNSEIEKMNKKEEKKKYPDIEERTFVFAVKVVRLVLKLPNNNVGTWKIGGQIISSATSVNSNIVQARSGISRNDFINHFRIARKEAKETQRWLQLMVAVDLVPEEKANLLIQENEEIIKILVTIVKNAEKNK